MIIKGEGKGKIRLKCEDCLEERVVQRNTFILEKSEHPCRVCSNKRNGVKKVGRPSWNSNKRKPEHEIQKGATFTNSHGYVEVYLGQYEAKAYGRNDKYVILHRKVMQDFLGRELDKKEIVHHIDGNKQNNAIENLYLCQDMSHHRDLHNNLEQVAFELIKSGIITFNNGVYETAPSYRNV